MKNGQTNQNNSKSSKFSKFAGKVPISLCLLINLATFVCTKTDLSKWKISNWIIFLIPYSLLFISSILWLYHWHRRKCIEEDHALEDLRYKRSKRRREEYELKKQQELQIKRLHVQNNFISLLSENPKLSNLSWDESDILGKNFYAEFTPFKDKSDESESKIRNIR